MWEMILLSWMNETLFIEIDKEVMNSQNNIIIGVLYRPPGTTIYIH